MAFKSPLALISFSGRGISLWFLVGLNLVLSAISCSGQIGGGKLEYVMVDGGSRPPTQPTEFPDKNHPNPDQSPPSEQITQPEPQTENPGVDMGPAQKVYYADVYKGFLNEFCGGCHGASGGRSRIDSYTNATHEIIAKEKTPVAYWTYVQQRLQKGQMPPVKPVPADEKQRFADGLALFERWAKAGFPEKEGGSTNPQDYKGKEDPYVLFPSTSTCKGVTPMPSRMWRLTTAQVQYSLLDIFGNQIKFPDMELSSERVGGVTNNSENLGLDGNDVTKLVKFYEAVSKEVISKSTRWKDCLAKTDNVCVKQLIALDGRRLWRRPLTQPEVDKLLGGFQTLVVDDRETALSYVLERILLSANFLFRSEVGQPEPGQEGLRRLTQHEVATFLSYTLWLSLPDEELLKAADEKRLGTPELVNVQLQRMLKDERSKRGLTEFLSDWLHIKNLLTQEKDASIFKNLTPQLRRDVVNAALKFFEHVVWTQKGSIADVFDSNVGFVNEAVAKLYDNVTATGTGLQQIKLDTNKRTGILTNPAFLMAHSGKDTTGFVHRGVFFLEQLLCRPVGDPPMGAVASGLERVGKVDTSKMTQREIMQTIHSADPSCNNCHKKIDPIGAAFEIFGPTGQYRTTEKGKTIDASGKIEGFGDLKPDFKNSVELIKNLAKSEHFKQCFTLKLYTHTWGRIPEGQRNCAVATLFEHLKGAQFGLLKMHQALLDNKQFFLRADPKAKK